MDTTVPSIAEQLALAAKNFQQEITGHTPSAVTIVLSEDTLVLTLHEALSPAELILAKSVEGASKLREYHQQLFRNSVGALRKEIERITGRTVRQAAVEVDPGTGSVVHAFTTGTTVQVFLFDSRASAGAFAPSDVGAPA